MFLDFSPVVWPSVLLALAIAFAVALNFGTSPDPKLTLMDSLMRAATRTAPKHQRRTAA